MDVEMSEENYNSENKLNGSTDLSGGKDEERKLFVGGLSWETTEKELKDYFTSYGEVESVNIKTDPTTGRSRGFSFVLFKNPDALDLIIQAGEHTIKDKKVDVKKAKLRPGKIFVGGLSPETTEEDVKEHFSTFGVVTAVDMPTDKEKNVRKGFCFVTLESDQTMYEIIKSPKQNIKGKLCDVKKATPRGDPFGVRGRGRGMMRGMGRGGYPMMPAYGPMDYGYGYAAYDPYYGYGAEYYGAGYGYDPYAYGAYDYSGFKGAANGAARGRGGPASGGGGKPRGGRGMRHAPY